MVDQSVTTRAPGSKCSRSGCWHVATAQSMYCFCDKCWLQCKSCGKWMSATIMEPVGGIDTDHRKTGFCSNCSRNTNYHTAPIPGVIVTETVIAVGPADEMDQLADMLNSMIRKFGGE